MREPGIPAAAEQITEDVADYVNMRIASAKLAFVEGASTVSGNALRIVIAIMFCFLGVVALLGAAIVALEELLGSFIWASLIVGGVCIILGLVFVACKKVFINPMVRMFSKMVFTSHKDERHEEE